MIFFSNTVKKIFFFSFDSKKKKKIEKKIMFFIRLLLLQLTTKKKSVDFNPILGDSKNIILEKIEYNFLNRKFQERFEINEESIEVIGCSFNNITTFSNGGALFLATTIVSISDSTFFYCSSAQYGGAIYCAQAESFSLNMSCFYRCYAINKGNAEAIFSTGDAKLSYIIDLYCKLDENTISLNYGTNAFVSSSAQLTNINCSKCSSAHEASFLSIDKPSGQTTVSFAHLDENYGWSSCTLLTSRNKLLINNINILNSTFTDSLFFISYEGTVTSGTFINNSFNEAVSQQFPVDVSFYFNDCYSDDWKYVADFVKMENVMSGSPQAGLRKFETFKIKNCYIPTIKKKKNWKKIILFTILIYCAFISLYILYKNSIILKLMAQGKTPDKLHSGNHKRRRRVLTV